MTPHAIILAVAAAFDLTIATLQSGNRTRYVSHARQAAAWALRQAFPELSLDAIGQLLGRDHTTIIFALQAVEQRMIGDPDLRALLRAITATRRPARRADDRVFWGVTIARTA